MKKTLTVLIIICCLSCKKRLTEDYYFSKTTYDIVKFNGKNSELFNLSDSTYTNKNFKFLDEDLVQIDFINYHYKSENDSLTLFDFPDDQELRTDTLVLVRFNYDKIVPENLKNKSWSMKLEQVNRSTNELYLEEEILDFKVDCYASYVRDNDTILGAVFYLDENKSKEFTIYSRNKYELIVPIKNNKNDLEIILFNGWNNNRIYSLNKIE